MTFETALAVAANSPYGHRPAATRPPPFLVKSPSGVPPSASTLKTADQPEQDTYKRRPPFGNRTSNGTLPYAAAAQAQMWGNPRLVEPLKITSAKIDIAGLQHALFVGVPRPAPPVSAGTSSRDLHDQGLCPDTEQMAGTSAWRSDTARGAGECLRVSCASIYRYRPGERKGSGAGPRPAQLPVAGAAPLVSDQSARAAADLLDRPRDPVWLRALAQNWLLPFTAFLPELAIIILLNNVAEEIGWTGFVFARFQDRHGPLPAALLTTVFFWLFHVSSFYVDTRSWATTALVLGIFLLPQLGGAGEDLQVGEAV
jgi:hypothetical protein